MALFEREEHADPPDRDREALRPTYSSVAHFTLCAGAALLGLSSVSCLVISVWAHVVALGGDDPRHTWSSLWVVQPLIVIVLAPIGVIIAIKGVKHDPFGLSRVVWRVQLALLVYYGFHFYLFLYRSQTILRAAYTWQMFSAGWIVLFALATAIYLTYARRCLSA